MSNWTPSRIGSLARSIESRAQEIDGMLWHKARYGVEDQANFEKRLNTLVGTLAVDIHAFNSLDTDAMLKELE